MSDRSRAEEELKALRSPPQSPKVFVSYSHESAEHKNWVLRLASDLRKLGIDAVLDVWDLKPGGDVARFMEHLASVDRVVIVCSEGYTAKAEAGKGGVGYETMLVTAEILQDRGVVKFIPLLRDNPRHEVPAFLRTRLWIDFERDVDYQGKLDELARALHEAPANPKPPLGTNPYGRSHHGIRDVFAEPWLTRHKAAAIVDVQTRGAFMEVAFGMPGSAIKADQRTLLNVAERSAIHTFGWPIGIVVHVDDRRPKPEADGIVTRMAMRVFSDYERADYWALRCNGDFYIAQNLFENSRDPNAIFFNTRMIRVAEAILYSRNLYNNLGVHEGTGVRFWCRHAGIDGRVLASSNPARMLSPFERRTTTSESEVAIEFEHPITDAAVVEKTRDVLDPLFVLFDYFKPDESIYQDVIGQFIQGRCT